MTSIDKYAYISKLNKMNPMLKFVIAVLSMVVCLGMDHIVVSVLIFLAMSWLTVVRGKISLKYYVKLLRIPLFFLVVGVLTIIINITSQPADLVSIPVFSKYVSISSEGLFTGIVLVFKAFGTVACLYFLSLSTPMFEITQVFNQLRCPKIFTELMLLIYRFIFLLMDTSHMMVISADSRLGYMTKKTWLNSTGMIAGSLFLKSFKRSMSMYNAMEARCYDGTIEFLNEEKPVKKRQIVLTVIYFVCILAVGIIFRLKGWMQ